MTKTLLFKETAARLLRGEGSFPTTAHDTLVEAGIRISVESMILPGEACPPVTRRTCQNLCVLKRKDIFVFLTKFPLLLRKCPQAW